MCKFEALSYLAAIQLWFVKDLNDDMYVLPGWDKELHKVIKELDTKMFMLSSTMIEPSETGNNCVVVKDYGLGLDSFKKSDLLNDFHSFKRSNWQGATWPPVLLQVTLPI